MAKMIDVEVCAGPSNLQVTLVIGGNEYDIDKDQARIIGQWLINCAGRIER